MKTRKPRVLTKCVANHYASETQRIIEFTGHNPDTGGLVSFIELDGTLYVDVYRHEKNVVVRVGKREDN